MITVDWSKRPEDLNRLLTWSNQELKEYYCSEPYFISWESLRRTRNKYRDKARKLAKMEKPAPGTDLDKLAQLFERSGIDIESIDKLREVSVYQGFYKDEEGEAQTVDLISARYTPKNEGEPESYISQADPVKIYPYKSTARKSNDERVIVLPDIQGGFRRSDNGMFLPTHDPKALDIALQVIKDVQPDKVVCNGDNLDFPTLGRFAQEAALFGTLNATLNHMHQFLATIRATSPKSEIIYIAGNHEERLRKFLMQNAPELNEIRVAGKGPRVNSVPFLLNLAEINVQYISGYPAGKYWLTDDLKVIHGYAARKRGGMTAAAYLAEEDTSTIYGHIHRREYAERTHGSRNSGRFVVAASFGCLADIQGGVPSYHSGIGEEGQPERHVEDWAQGLGYVEISKKSGKFALQQIRIETFDGYETKFGGKTYTPKEPK